MSEKQDPYETNLMRMVAANSGALLLLQISRDLFGKPYFSLGEVEMRSVNSNFDQLSRQMFHFLNTDVFPKIDGAKEKETGFRPGSHSEDKS